MVDLYGNPFYLDEEGVRWVKETIKGMSQHEKICQLFADPLMGMSREELIEFLEEYPIGGIPFRAALFGNEQAQDIMAELQERSKIPYLYAGNCESGPNGALKGGTLVASGAQVRALRDPQYAYEVGRISGKETAAVGFNGLAVTDQTKMMGYYGMSRLKEVPWTIACGCDMVLGINDMEEDYAAMKEGIESGMITPERLQDALERILGCKAALGLHKKKQENRFHPGKEALQAIGCKEHQEIAGEAGAKAVTLVKNTKGQIPISPAVYKKIGVFVFSGNVGNQRSIYGQGVQSGGSDATTGYILDALKKYGYEPELMESSMNKGSIRTLKSRYDAIMIFADISGFAQTNSVRLMWPDPMSNCYPWYIHDVPTVFTSFNYTNHLIDVSRVPAFINAYNNRQDTIEETVKRIAGLEPFEGQYEDNVWCGTWDARF